MLLNASGANAAVYKFTFNSFDDELTATGEITVNPAEQVTAVSGVISGLVDQTITAVTPNPNFSSPAYSPDGSFIYNNVYYPTGMAFDTNGLLFVTAQNRAAIGTSGALRPAIIRFGSWPARKITRLEESGSLSVAGAELSTSAMLAVGFAGLGLVGGRRKTVRLAPSLG